MVEDCAASYSTAGCGDGDCVLRHRTLDDNPTHNWYCAEWILTRSCRHGSRCHFIHPSNEWLAVTDCPDFLTCGTCRFENEAAGCPMRHSTGLRRGVLDRRWKVCLTWAHPGTYFKCPDGLACKHYHCQNVTLSRAMGRRVTQPTTPAASAVDDEVDRPPSPPPPPAPRPSRSHTASPAATAATAAAPATTVMAGAGEADTGLPPLVVCLWDIENTGIPRFDTAFSPADMVDQLQREVARVAGISLPMEINVHVYYNVNAGNQYVPSATVVRHLRAAGITIVHTGDKPGAADHAIKQEVDTTIRKIRRGLRVSAVVMMSSDSDFADKLRDLKLQWVVTVLVRGDTANRTLLASADHVIHWKSISERRRGGRGVGVGGATICQQFTMMGGCTAGERCPNRHVGAPGANRPVPALLSTHPTIARLAEREGDEGAGGAGGGAGGWPSLPGERVKSRRLPTLMGGKSRGGSTGRAPMARTTTTAHPVDADDDDDHVGEADDEMTFVDGGIRVHGQFYPLDDVPPNAFSSVPQAPTLDGLGWVGGNDGGRGRTGPTSGTSPVAPAAADDPLPTTMAPAVANLFARARAAATVTDGSGSSVLARPVGEEGEVVSFGYEHTSGGSDPAVTVEATPPSASTPVTHARGGGGAGAMVDGAMVAGGSSSQAWLQRTAAFVDSMLLHSEHARLAGQTEV